MSIQPRPLRLAIIAGEESGDLLGADLVAELKRQTGGNVVLAGLGGPHLQAEGLETLFDPSEISLMGFTAILARLPRLLRLIGTTARHVTQFKPDVLVIIDAPEFTHRVARRVRGKLPDVPVINYVCPSVWAWRPERAAAMQGLVDEILCLLPFEPGALKALDGPPGTFVGHRLSHDPDVLAVRDKRRARDGAPSGTLLLLPGSRSGEIERLAPDMLATARLMLTSGKAKRVQIATLPRHVERVRALAQSSGVEVEIYAGPEGKWAAFAQADAALAASGTVILELALAGVPCASVYRMDWLAGRLLTRIVAAWSGALPNLIADRVVVPDHYEQFFRPQYHARLMAGLMDPQSPNHQAQQAGYASVIQAMETKRPAAEVAAGRVLAWAKWRAITSGD